MWLFQCPDIFSLEDKCFKILPGFWGLLGVTVVKRSIYSIVKK